MATTTLLQAPTNASPQIALALSQAAPSYIKSQSSSWSLPYPFSLISNSESQEKWQIHENLFLACLRTGDNDSASALLRELTTRFGEDNERVAALRGLYAEANATTPQDLQNVLEHYGEILKEDPTCFAIRKRRVALLKSMGKIPEAITALTNLLDTSPTDAEGWAELADLYMSQGLLEQAIFSLEEAILLAANAWNLQAKLGEVQWVYAAQKEVGSGDQWRVLSESMRRFCRSVELCDDYLRGYYGLKMVCREDVPSMADAARSTVQVLIYLRRPRTVYWNYSQQRRSRS